MTRELAGRYRLDALLGRGGMGEVWRGVDLLLRRPVAVKIISAGFDAEPELSARLRREALAAAAVHHPGVTTVFDAGDEDGRPYIIMELLAGRDLDAVLRDHPSGLPVREVVQIARQAVSALDAAHSRGIVHRDLKPANLMLLDDGTVKICDFGISRIADATSGMTVTGQIIGTPAYMAPEQYSGLPSTTHTDLYALGCTLYALLTGAPPFSAAEHLVALMRRHLDEPPPQLPPAIPAGLRDFVTGLLAKDPADRPTDTTAVLDRLAALDEPPAGSTPPTDPVPNAARRPEPSAEQAVPPTSPPLAAPPVTRSPQPSTTLLDDRAVPSARPTGPVIHRSAAVPVIAMVTVAAVLAVLLMIFDGGDGSPAPAAPTFQPLQTFHLGYEAEEFAFSGDGDLLATRSLDMHDREIDVWDVGSGKVKHTLKTPDSSSGLEFSSDGRFLATKDGSARLWDSATGKLLWSLPGRLTRFWGFSSDGRTALTMNLAERSLSYHVLELRETETGRVRIRLAGTYKWLRSVAFSGDGRSVVGTGDSSILSWDVLTGESTVLGQTLKNMVVSPTGRSAVISDYISGALCKPDGTEILSLPNEKFSYSPDGRFLINSEAEAFFVRDADTGTEIRRIPTQSGHRHHLFSPDSRILVDDGALRSRLRLWNMEDQTLIAELPLGGSVRHMAFSSDSGLLASTNNKGGVQIWKTRG
ncbi:WD40 repeat domain-containing serine/threonine protein kinase [Actinocorallia libanotica]|uniref:non-specific serine/threonine protein kinase n=1 Tax=Actinocorallia libanotica TaxID=46162 RepID=A0ABN1S113_9ACTN